jgi:hypothetical protein
MEGLLEHAFLRPQLCLHLRARGQHDDLRQHTADILPSRAQATQEVCRPGGAEETQIEENQRRIVSRWDSLVSPDEGSMSVGTHRGAIPCQLKRPAEQVLDHRLILGDQDVRHSRNMLYPGKCCAPICVVSVSSRHRAFFLLRETRARPCLAQCASLFEERSSTHEPQLAVSHASSDASIG